MNTPILLRDDAPRRGGQPRGDSTLDRARCLSGQALVGGALLIAKARRASVAPAAMTMLIVLTVLVSASYAYAAVLDQKEAETMTLSGDANVSANGQNVWLDKNKAAATWEDGGNIAGDSVIARVAVNIPATTRVCITLLLNGSAQSSRCVPAGQTAFVNVSWSGLTLNDSTNLTFRASEVGSNEIMFLDSARVEATLLDTTPPETTIDSGPGGDLANPTFTFSSNESGSTFECRLDETAFTLCISPKSYTNLAAGSHSFDVRAKDAAGNTDQSPATRTFTVDLPEPSTCPSSAPAGYVRVSGSPSDELGSGNNVYFPAGTYTAGTWSLQAGQSVSGAGASSVNLGNTRFILTRNSKVECVHLVGAANTGEAIQLTGGSTGNVIRNNRIDQYKFGIHGKPYSSAQILNNTFRENDYSIYGIYRNTLVEGNDAVHNKNGNQENRFSEMQAGENITLRNNTIDGGEVGMIFLSFFDLAAKRLPTRNITFEGNNIKNVDEEYIGTDSNGGSAGRTNVRAQDSVSSVSGNTITTNVAWSGSPWGNGNYDVAFYNGPCKGRVFGIASQSGRQLNIDNLTCTPQSGNIFLIGMPFKDITIRNNTIDATRGLAGVSLWGFTYRVTVEGNVIKGPDVARFHPNEPIGASIRPVALQGLEASALQGTHPCGTIAPVDDIHVSNNLILQGTGTPVLNTDRVLVVSKKYGAASSCAHYSQSLNTYSGSEMPVVFTNQ